MLFQTAMFSLLAALGTAQEPTPDTVVRDFVTAYRDCGLTPTFQPVAEIRTHPALISYSNADRKVVVSRYHELPPPLRQQLEISAPVLGLSDGEAVFEAIFVRLGSAHEMGHWQQHVSGRFATLDRWDSELEANRIAIAFWSRDSDDAAGLSNVVEGWIQVMGALPNPVPEGRDPRGYFQAHYRDILQDPAAYGWFQGQFVREAWTRRDEADFCDLSRLNAPGPAEAD